MRGLGSAFHVLYPIYDEVLTFTAPMTTWLWNSLPMTPSMLKG